MRTYKFSKWYSEEQRDLCVIALRKGGYCASRDSEHLYTDASVAAIGMAFGNALIIEVLMTNPICESMQSKLRSKAWSLGFARAIRQGQVERDTQAMFEALQDDNEHRVGRGLPTFDPSHELARKIITS